jgi:sortase A
MRRIALLGNALAAVGALILVRPASHLATGLRAQATAVPPSPAAAAPRDRSPLEGEPLGRLELPRLGLDLVVFEGTSDSILRKGPGHLAGSAWPDGPAASGNCVITGHRDSFFRSLESARRNDLVRIHGASGISTYRLEERRIVRPRDVSVVAPTREARLTLITCFPFRWSGSAPYRLIWRAVPADTGPGAERAGLPVTVH